MTVCFQDGGPPAIHRALRNGTLTRWEAAGCPPVGQRPGEGDALATRPNGAKVLRYNGASPSRELEGAILLISVDWVPPYWGPSGAGVGLGTRVDRSRLLTCVEGYATIGGPVSPQPLGVLRARRHRAGDGPHESDQLTRNRGHHDVGMLAARNEAAVARTETDLRLPAEVLQGPRQLVDAVLDVRRHLAGWRYAQAASTSTRRARPLPALVMPPCRPAVPLEYSEGMSSDRIF